MTGYRFQDGAVYATIVEALRNREPGDGTVLEVVEFTSTGMDETGQFAEQHIVSAKPYTNNQLAAMGLAAGALAVVALGTPRLKIVVEGAIQWYAERTERPPVEAAYINPATRSWIAYYAVRCARGAVAGSALDTAIYASYLVQSVVDRLTDEVALCDYCDRLEIMIESLLAGSEDVTPRKLARILDVPTSEEA